MSSDFVSRYEYLEEVAAAIDASASWQFLAAHREGEELGFTVVSKNSIPLLEAAAFSGIEASISIDSEDRETYSKMHVVHYVGDIVGLEMFVDYLTGDLDGRTEGNENPIEGFRQRNPLWGLAVFGHRK